MKKLGIIAVLAFAFALTANAQNTYATPYSACSGSPLVCTVPLQVNFTQEVANLVITFNSGLSPSNQNTNSFGVVSHYGPGEGSNISIAAASLPVIWGYEPGAYYHANFTLQYGTLQSTKAAFDIEFKLIGTVWYAVASPNAGNGVDLTSSY